MTKHFLCARHCIVTVCTPLWPYKLVSLAQFYQWRDGSPECRCDKPGLELSLTPSPMLSSPSLCASLGTVVVSGHWVGTDGQVHRWQSSRQPWLLWTEVSTNYRGEGCSQQTDEVLETETLSFCPISKQIWSFFNRKSKTALPVSQPWVCSSEYCHLPALCPLLCGSSWVRMYCGRQFLLCAPSAPNPTLALALC